MSIPYTAIVSAQTLPSAANSTVTVNVPNRGIVTKLIVKQTSGTLEGYTVDLYSRIEAANGDLDTFENDLYKLMSQVTVASSASVTEQYALVSSYVNEDDRDTILEKPLNRLHLRINPAGTGNKNFEIAITVTAEVLG